MSITLNEPFVMIGAGKMGGAILKGLLAAGLDPADVVVQDPKPPADMAEFLAQHAIKPVVEIKDLAMPPAVIMTAVKPQVMDVVFPPAGKLAGPNTIVLSVAAGRSIASFETHVAKGVCVVRAMPNTPAAVGEGMTVCCGNDAMTQEQKTACTTLLQSIGKVGWVETEVLIDAVTGVSGSGPAYVFWLAECMAAAGIEAGLDEDLAVELARQTVAGSGVLMAKTSQSATDLRKAVTSPGGTTEAALAVLMREPNGLRDLMVEAVARAKKRGQDLAS
ncbi:MAG: pyrroline-5-carboxylate reductase [Hyphomicrobiaceae bacterium]